MMGRAKRAAVVGRIVSELVQSAEFDGVESPDELKAVLLDAWLAAEPRISELTSGGQTTTSGGEARGPGGGD